MKTTLRFLFILILFISGHTIVSAQITADSVPPGMFAVNPYVSLSVAPCTTADTMSFDINCDNSHDVIFRLYKGATVIDGANTAFLYILNDSIEVCKDTGGMVSGYARPHYFNAGDALVPPANSMWGTDSVYQFGDYGCMSCTGPSSQTNMYIAYRKAGQTGWMKVSFSLTDGGSCVAPITFSVQLILLPCLPSDVPSLTNETNLEVNPNPFSETTILSTDQPLRNGTLVVYNSFGQIVRQSDNLEGQSITFHRDNLPEGVYFLSLSDEGEMISVRKVVIAD
ncbi:MAG TPA: T9SS type A sorting domain-containing protein [Bacteroidia bacterium]|nr:T9SS type A sorting domain-containing protein [Bacteroidia bacterium]